MDNVRLLVQKEHILLQPNVLIALIHVLIVSQPPNANRVYLDLVLMRQCVKKYVQLVTIYPMKINVSNALMGVIVVREKQITVWHVKMDSI